MGLSVSSCSVWSRDLESDSYLPQSDWIRYRRNDVDPLTFQELAMSHFKHSIYKFALVKYPYNTKNTKAIYLYADSGVHDRLGIRMMKCEFKGSSLYIYFRNEKVKQLWNNTDEKFEWFTKDSNGPLWQNFNDKWEFSKLEEPGYVSFGKIVWRKKYRYKKNGITSNQHVNNYGYAYNYILEDTI